MRVGAINKVSVMSMDNDPVMQNLKEIITGKTEELEISLKLQRSTSREIVERLARAAELRDEDAGSHIKRIGLFAGTIARHLGIPDDIVEMLTLATEMHDIGKIGIPDTILFKPDPLTPSEFEIIKLHTIIGEQILRDSSHPLLQMAAVVALNHHERWDGTGYPNRLRGEAIPLAGRIVMLADQYDALRSKRVYKPSFDHGTVCAIILEGDAATRPEHFDPQVLRAFAESEHLFEKIYEQYLDRPDGRKNGFDRVKEILRLFGTPEGG